MCPKVFWKTLLNISTLHIEGFGQGGATPATSQSQVSLLQNAQVALACTTSPRSIYLAILTSGCIIQQRYSKRRLESQMFHGYLYFRLHCTRYIHQIPMSLLVTASRGLNLPSSLLRLAVTFLHIPSDLLKDYLICYNGSSGQLRSVHSDTKVFGNLSRTKLWPWGGR